MKTILDLRYLFILAMVGMVTFSSCSEDDADGDISGCTDVEAENYDPDATVSANTCVYARDKFKGSYEGSLTFDSTTELNQDSVDFVILDNITGANDVAINFTIMDLPTTISGTALADSLFINSKVVIPNGGVINPLLEGQSVDIFFAGKIILSNNGNTINGPLDVEAKSTGSGATLITDIATLNGERK